MSTNPPNIRIPSGTPTPLKSPMPNTVRPQTASKLPGIASPWPGMRFPWYKEPFSAISLSSFTKDQDKARDTSFLMLPPHADNPWGDDGFSMQVEYIRIDAALNLKPEFRENRPQGMQGTLIEVPLLSNWGVPREQDPITTLSWALYLKHNRTMDRGGYKWLYPKHRYIFLVANAQPALQAAQKGPYVLALPGDYKDNTEGSQKSIGYNVANLHRERVTLEWMPNVGDLKYGYVTDPNSQPVIVIKRTSGKLPQDYRYTYDVATPNKQDWVALQNRALLEQIRPLPEVLQRPPMEYYLKLLRMSVEPSIINECIPQFAPAIFGTNEALGMPNIVQTTTPTTPAVVQSLPPANIITQAAAPNALHEATAVNTLPQATVTASVATPPVPIPAPVAVTVPPPAAAAVVATPPAPLATPTTPAPTPYDHIMGIKTPTDNNQFEELLATLVPYPKALVLLLRKDADVKNVRDFVAIIENTPVYKIWEPYLIFRDGPTPA